MPRPKKKRKTAFAAFLLAMLMPLISKADTVYLGATYTTQTTGFGAQTASQLYGVDPAGIFRQVQVDISGNIKTTSGGGAASNVTVLDNAGNSIAGLTVNGVRRLGVNLASGSLSGTAATGFVDVVGGIDGSGIAQPFQFDINKNVKVSVTPTAQNLFYLRTDAYYNGLSLSQTGAVVIVGGPNGLANNSSSIPFAVQLSQNNTPIALSNPLSSGLVGAVDANPVNNQNIRIANIFKPQSAVSTNAAATLWTPTGGKKFRLMGYHLSASVAGNVTLFDGAVTITVVPSGAGGSGVAVSLGQGYLSANISGVLSAVGPAASTTSGILYGTEE